jgi:prepilin-type N-terminal cleavage/methylation domain-containing protein
MLRRMRAAFTLVELLVAIVVLTVGLLALAATAGLVASQVGDGGRLTGAAHVAHSLLDSLALNDCTTVVSGVSRRQGSVASWDVARDTLAARVEMRVGTELRRGSRDDTYRLVVPCAR